MFFILYFFIFYGCINLIFRYSIKFSYRKLNGYLYMMNGVGATKKLHTVQKIGTHDGTFHCDEVLACAMLKLLPSFKHAEIIRYMYSLLYIFEW